MQLSAQVSSLSSAKGQYLKFNLLTNMAASLPVEQLVAVLKIEAGQITTIPHLPPWIMGVYNWRGEILWIIDIGHLLGGTPLSQKTTLVAQYNILLLEQPSGSTTEPSHLGVAVCQVQDIKLLSLDNIQSPTVISETLVPFLRGYWLETTGEMLVLLEPAAIFAHMPV